MISGDQSQGSEEKASDELKMPPKATARFAAPAGQQSHRQYRAGDSVGNPGKHSCTLFKEVVRWQTWGPRPPTEPSSPGQGSPGLGASPEEPRLQGFPRAGRQGRGSRCHRRRGARCSGLRPRATDTHQSAPARGGSPHRPRRCTASSAWSCTRTWGTWSRSSGGSR